MAKFEYFDLNKKWNDYGIVQDISTLDSNELSLKLREFSEGSEDLYNLLLYLNQNGFKTKACCKGSHLSIKTDNSVGISSNAYIAFQDKEWLNYLSNEILDDKNIIISTEGIYYYGENPNKFFNRLLNSFESKKMSDKNKLDIKLLEKASLELQKKGFKNALTNIGFNKKQIKDIYDSYWTFKDINKRIKYDKSRKLYELNMIAYNNHIKIVREAVEYNNKICER